MNVGAEPKKLVILGALVTVAGLVYWINSGDDAPPAGNARRTGPAPASTAQPAPSNPGATAGPLSLSPSSSPRAGRPANPRSQEFRPSMKPKRPEERPDPMTADPTLRLDLLAALQAVKIQGGRRSLFDFAAAPPPKTPDVKIVPKPLKPEPVKEAAKAPAEQPATLGKPAPPPIPLKFYGYVAQQRQGPKRAFFLDGDEIFVAAEGDVIKKRYKVIRIGVNSVIVEDLEHSHQQTLPIEQQPV